MLQKRAKQYFNMVEVTLALGVLALGFASIMALFPAGVNATKDAVGNSYAADAADQFLSYIELNSKSTWSFATGLPSTYGGAGTIADTDTNIDWSGETPAFGNIYAGTGTPIPSGIYGVQVSSPSSVDFQAHVKLWRQDIDDFYSASQVGSEMQNLGTSKAVMVYAEVSWPVQVPYSKRNKRVYCIEIFNNN